MKRILLSVSFLLSFLFINNLRAELPQGAAATDWTATDLNGTTWNLFDLLDAGKPVVIDFSATWCGPCWNYHNTHVLNNLYNAYGPNGTDEIMVFFIEADLSTNTSCLYGSAGCVGGTQGNWVNGTNYPIIDLIPATSYIKTNYAITYYPTLYAISPDRKVYEVGQAPIGTWEGWLFQSFNMAVSGSVTPSSCPNTGEIDITVTSGYLNKSYDWSNGATTQDLVGVNPGNYTVTVSDANGYEVVKSYTVGGPSTQLNLNNVSQSNVTCNNYANGAIYLSPSGGYPGYTYEWNTGATGSSIEDLGPGDYTVVVTDNQGCEVMGIYVIEEPEELTALTFTNPATCNNSNGAVTIDSEGGTGNHIYQLGTLPATTYNTFFDLAAGIYNYTVTDFNGCFTTGSFEIESIGTPIAAAAPSGVLDCANTQVSVSGAGSTTGNNITYLWTTTNGNIVSGATSLQAIVNAAGTYTLQVTNTSANCVSTTSTQVTAVNNAPVANAGLPQNLTCAVTTTTLNGTTSSSGPNFTYLWTTANGNITGGATTPNAEVNEPGSYNLLVTNTTNGCTSNSSVEVTEDVTTPAIAVTNGELTCSVNSVEICATVAPTSTVSWMFNGSPVAANCITVNSAGEFTATATGTNGCISNAISTVTSAAGLPEISAETPGTLTCIVSEITLAGQVTGNPADFTITWATVNGNIVSGGNTLTPLVNEPGIYVMTAVNNLTTCTSNLSVVVEEIINAPVAQFTASLVNGQLTLTNTGNGSANWELGNGQQATGNSVTISYAAAGTYTICLTNTTECGENTSCNEISYVTALALTGDVVHNICFEGTSGSITPIVTGGPVTGVLTYNWTGPNGFTSTSASISGLTAGTYTCVITDEVGLTTSSTFVVNEGQAIEATANITNASNGASNGAITLAALGGAGTLSISWSNGATGASIENLAPGSYTAIVTDETGCQRTFGPFVVETVSAVEDPAFLTAFKIYPNPTSDVLNFEINAVNDLDAAMNIYTATGKKVWTKVAYKGSNIADRIDVSSLNTGIYVLEMKTAEGIAHRKFIVTK
ncbi:MAG: T9SS type A sorting domain-containing protein [Saprospiraceae bacterium]|nr:T9SS type A sorting domain-containing protein [Saprospiraceae bacterium]